MDAELSTNFLSLLICSDREVIQHEICRYLGNDATVR